MVQQEAKTGPGLLKESTREPQLLVLRHDSNFSTTQETRMPAQRNPVSSETLCKHGWYRIKTTQLADVGSAKPKLGVCSGSLITEQEQV